MIYRCYRGEIRRQQRIFPVLSSPHPHSNFTSPRNPLRQKQYGQYASPNTTTQPLGGGGDATVISTHSTLSIPNRQHHTVPQRIHPIIPVRHSWRLQQAQASRPRSQFWQRQDFGSWTQGSKAAWKGTIWHEWRSNSRRGCQW